MDDVLTLLRTAADGFTERVDQVPPTGWEAPTPDSGWTVRDLVGHLAREHRQVPGLLAGGPAEETGDDVLGEDPAGAWRSAVAASLAAWEGLDDLDGLVALPSGRAPARQLAEQMLLDLTVHTWDLARALALDPVLHPACVRHALAYVQLDQERLRGSGLYGEPLLIDSPDPQDQLLGLLGRRP